MKTGGEHAAHAIRRGPDGWLYVLCGNNTGIDKSSRRRCRPRRSRSRSPAACCASRPTSRTARSSPTASATPTTWTSTSTASCSPSTPTTSAASACRGTSRRGSTTSIAGRALRLAQSPQRAQTFWRMPPYFPTWSRRSRRSAAARRPASSAIGTRSSPRSTAAASSSRDWTFGKVWLRARSKRASYTRSRVFLEATGDNGFAPTGLAVHPKTGDLYVSIGGRGTRGAVYRVRYPKGMTHDLAAEAAKMKMTPTAGGGSWQG